MFIELAVQMEWEGSTVTVFTDWWSADEGRMESANPLWAYLVRVIDQQDVQHYYYFRTDYSGCTA